ncbi:MAG: sulfatase family protein [Actinomycetota bacterium]
MRTPSGTPFQIVARLAVIVTLTMGAATAAAVTRDAGAVAEPSPNVIIIVTDDQRRELLQRDAMPATTRLFAGGGTKFTRAYATTPLCCPSRASIFSGRYAHNHGVENNQQAGSFDEDFSVQRYLRDQGYRTALFGKFLLGRPLDDDPEHFDEWATFLRSPMTYRDGNWNVDGTVQEVPGYSTTYIGERAVGFIEEQESVDIQPWMMMLSTAAPHAPFLPDETYAGATVPRWDPDAAVGERRLGDKPPFERIGDASRRESARIRRRQVRTLFSVDDMIRDVFDALGRTGESNTLAFFLSDNGYMWAEHGLSGKRYPYLPSTRIPLLMRWPGRVAAGFRDRHLVATIDIAPTILDAAGITPDDAYPIDGHSLLGNRSRDRLLLEFEPEGGLWPWASTITRRYQYIEHYADSGRALFHEYYDLRRDPAQLRNLYGDRNADNDPARRDLRRTLARDKGCAGSTCP